MSEPGERPLWKIVGLGSPHGDDQFGWRFVEHLASDPVRGCEWALAANPTRLLEHCSREQPLIVIDACRTGAAPGRIFRWQWPDPAIGVQNPASSHGLGLAEMLELATRLERLPPRVILYAVEAASCRPRRAAEPCPGRPIS